MQQQNLVLKKFFIFMIILLVSISSFSQRLKKMSPPIKPETAPITFPVYSGLSSQHQISTQLGLFAGALNLGVSYIQPKTELYGFGGYFFMQTSKEKNYSTIVSQVVSFGGLVNINLMDNTNFRIYLSPGFGLSILKESSINSGTKNDETVVGPVIKMGVQYKISPTFFVGLDKTDFTNWLNDNVNNFQGPNGFDYFSVVGTFLF